jgi:hypothetical protein
MDDHEIRIQKLEAEVAAQRKWFVDVLLLARTHLPEEFVGKVSEILGGLLYPSRAPMEPGEEFRPLPSPDAELVHEILYAIEGD